MNQWKHILIVFITCLLSACVSSPHSQISAYAVAVEDLTKNVDQLFDSYQQTSIDQKVSRYAIETSDQSLNTNYKLSLQMVESMQTPMTGNVRQKLVLIKINRALGDYAKALQTLSVAGNQHQIDMAVVELSGAVTEFGEQYLLASEGLGREVDFESYQDKSSLVFAAISTAGQLLADQKRNKAMKEIIISMDEIMPDITGLMLREVERLNLAQIITLDKNIMLADRITDYNQKAENQMLTYMQAQNELREIIRFWQEMASANLQQEAIKKAIQKLASTHAVLRKEVEKNRFNSEEISGVIGELKVYRNQFKSFNDILATCSGKIELEHGSLICVE